MEYSGVSEDGHPLSPLSPTHSRPVSPSQSQSQSQAPWTHRQYPLESPFAQLPFETHALHDDHNDHNDNDSDGDSDAPPPSNLIVQDTRQQNSVQKKVSRKQPLATLRRALANPWSAFPDQQQHQQSLRLDSASAPLLDPTINLHSPGRTSATSPISQHSNGNYFNNNNNNCIDDDEENASPVRFNHERDLDDDVDDKTRALRSWASIEPENLDLHLQRIYSYFVEKGFFAVVLGRVCNLIILAFIVGFSTFTFSCIDHSRIHKHKSLSEVIIPQCLKTLPGIQTFFLILFSIWWLSQLAHLILDLPTLYQTKLIYNHVLEITDAEMDTIEWQDIVTKLTQLKYSLPLESQNPYTRNLDAHTIVNRIMRKENYLMGMFNKEILSLRLPGILGRAFGGGINRKGGLWVTKVMEWNLYFCILLYAFDENGLLRKRFLKGTHRRRLVVGLQKRFELMAFLNLLFSPFLIVITVLYFVFKFAEEYQKSPASLSARAYTLHAQYILRDFNELPHLFNTRLNRSHPLAVSYLSQFRNQKQILVARLISFLTAGILTALALLAIVDQELTEFEITPGRSALFYATIFGGILATVRNMIPDETRLFEPKRALEQVIQETHYCPHDWKSRLHTEQVKSEFSKLFDLKVTHLVWELVSIPVAPLILYYSLPMCAEAVVDFLRECTVDMEGVGFVCSFAAFDLARYGNPKYGVPTTSTAQDGVAGNVGMVSKEGKMEQSFLYFKAQYPGWDEGVDGSLYLQALGRSVGGGAFGGRGVGLRGEASVLWEGGGRSKRSVKFGSPLAQGATGGGGGNSNVRMVDLSSLERSAIDDEDGPAETVGILGILDAVYEANKGTRL